MRRRDFLAGLAGTGIVGGGAYMALSSSTDTIRPVEIDLFDAPGSPGGTLRVPATGEPTVLDLFATTCEPCKPAIDALATASQQTSAVQFVSVTGEYLGGGRTRDDVVEWWATYGGGWPVGYDPDGVLLGRLEADAIPFTAVIDVAGSVVWSHAGVPNAETVTRAIADARP